MIHILLPPVSWRTFGAVSDDALSDNELPLPQHCPDQICRTTADLDHFPGDRHLLPQRALGIVVTDSLSEPHLDGEDTTIKSDSRTVSEENKNYSHEEMQIHFFYIYIIFI